MVMGLNCEVSSDLLYLIVLSSIHSRLWEPDELLGDSQGDTVDSGVGKRGNVVPMDYITAF